MKDRYEILIMHERLLGIILFHLWCVFSGIIYCMGQDTLIDITKLILMKCNHTITGNELIITQPSWWMASGLVEYTNNYIYGCVMLLNYIRLCIMSLVEMILLSFNYGILSTVCVCMIMGTMVTFMSMKVYRSDVYIGVFGIKITN